MLHPHIRMPASHNYLYLENRLCYLHFEHYLCISLSQLLTSRVLPLLHTFEHYLSISLLQLFTLKALPLLLTFRASLLLLIFKVSSPLFTFRASPLHQLIIAAYIQSIASATYIQSIVLLVTFKALPLLLIFGISPCISFITMVYISSPNLYINIRLRLGDYYNTSIFASLNYYCQHIYYSIAIKYACHIIVSMSYTIFTTNNTCSTLSFYYCQHATCITIVLLLH